MTLTTCPETLADIPAINMVVQSAFHDHPHSLHNEQDIVAALRNSLGEVNIKKSSWR